MNRHGLTLFVGEGFFVLQFIHTVNRVMLNTLNRDRSVGHNYSQKTDFSGHLPLITSRL